MSLFYNAELCDSATFCQLPKDLGFPRSFGGYATCIHRCLSWSLPYRFCRSFVDLRNIASLRSVNHERNAGQKSQDKSDSDNHAVNQQSFREKSGKQKPVWFKPTALAALISHEVAAGQQSLAMFGGIHLVRFHGSPTQEIHVWIFEYLKDPYALPDVAEPIARQLGQRTPCEGMKQITQHFKLAFAESTG